MDRQPDLRSEVIFGAVFGFGLSALGWTLVFAPPALDPAGFALIGLAGIAGALRRPNLAPDGQGAFIPVAIATLALFGLGAAVIASALSATIRLAKKSLDPPRPRFRRAAFDLGVRCTATAVGGAAWIASGGGPERTAVWALVPAATAFAIAYALMRFIMVRYAFPRPTPAPTDRGAFVSGIGGSLAGWTLAVCAGLVLTEIYRQDALRVGLLAGPLIYFMVLLGRSRSEQSEIRKRRQEQSERIHRAIGRALTRGPVDDTESSEHLFRVQSLCIAVGEQLDLSPEELDVLSTAALLHDIGKIAVPEPILLKASRLTAKEMECVKVHPAFGAEVLDALSFPAPIRLIVRHHHERWDGRGYPDGLEGEDIPLGARILAAVDCFDAMTSNRPFRKAFPASVAKRHLQNESEVMFDPVVVDALLDQIEQEQDPAVATPHGTDRIPAALPSATTRSASIQKLLDSHYAIARATRYPIEFDECCTLVRAQLTELVPHGCLAVYVHDTDRDCLIPRFVAGEAADRIERVRLDLGDSISGSAMTELRIVVGQDHSTRAKALSPRSDLEEFLSEPAIRRLGSSLSVPLVYAGICVGVLTLYDNDDRRFTDEDRRILGTVAGHLTHAMIRDSAGSSADALGLTDPQTGLPDARFLSLEATRRFLDADHEDHHCEALIGIRVGGLADLAAGCGIDAVERAISQIARRLAANCLGQEALVRLGPDLFAILIPVDDEEAFIHRFNTLQHVIAQHPLELPSQRFSRLRFDVAQVRFPDDGVDVESLVSVLDARLAARTETAGRVVNFRGSRIA